MDLSDAVVWIISDEAFGSFLDYDNFEVNFLLFEIINLLLTV